MHTSLLRMAARPQARRTRPRSQGDADSLSSWTCYPQVQTHRKHDLTPKRDKTMAICCDAKKNLRAAVQLASCRSTRERLIPESVNGGASGAASPASADDDDMEPARPMGAEQQRLLDVGRARR